MVKCDKIPVVISDQKQCFPVTALSYFLYCYNSDVFNLVKESILCLCTGVLTSFVVKGDGHFRGDSTIHGVNILYSNTSNSNTMSTRKWLQCCVASCLGNGGKM